MIWDWTWTKQDGFVECTTDPIGWREGDMEEQLEAVKYKQHWTGEEAVGAKLYLDHLPGICAIWYFDGEGEPPGGFQYYASMNIPGDRTVSVWLKDVPDLLGLLAEVQPSAWLQSLAENMQRLETMVGKLFHVQHGHEPDESCWECDPTGARMDEMRRERARERRAAEARAKEGGA